MPVDDNYIMPFGKYKGTPLKDVKHGYWRYMYDRKKLTGDILKYVEEIVPDIKVMVEKKTNKTNTES